MGLDGDHLLKRLHPVVRPCGPEFPPRRKGTLEGAGFEELIEMASQGQLASGRPVVASVAHELDQDRLDRLSTACDALEAAGIERGAVLMEGRAFLMDVPGREILREVVREDAGTVESLAGVLRVLGPDESGVAESTTAPAPRTLRANPAVPPGVLAQLERAAPNERPSRGV